MALRLRSSKDVKKSSYYVWYLGAREAKGVDAMPGAIAYLLERERLQEPFKVTLQVSSKGLKIIQTVHPGMSTKSAVKHLVPGHAVLAAVQREDVVAATLLLPNPATNNPVHVHAYRCDSVETAELLGGQLKVLASNSDNSTKVNGSDNRIRSNLGSDGRSTRESESSEGSGEHRHIPVQTTTIYESLAAELRAKLGRGNSGDNDVGPILLPPRDYDTVHRHRGNLAGIEFRRCLNQTIVGGNTAIERGGTRSAASSGIGSDSAATPPPYQPHHPLGPRPSRPSRDTSSDEDWGGVNEDNEYLPESNSNMALPRVTRSPERPIGLTRGVSPNSNRLRRAPELRQRSPSPQYQPKIDPIEVTSPRERFQDAKEMFKAMERENNARPVIVRSRETSESHGKHKLEQSRLHDERISRHMLSNASHSAPVHSDHMIRRSHPNLDREKEREHNDYKYKSRSRGQSYSTDHLESSRPRPRSFYENSSNGREQKEQRHHVIDLRETKEIRDRHSRELREKQRIRPMAYQEIPKHDRYLDRESTRQSFDILPTPGRYRHSYAEPPRLGLAALDPYYILFIIQETMRGSNQDTATPYCRCRVLYLGSSVPHASKEGLLGVQEPLRELYPEQGALGARGIDSWLSVWSNGLLLENVDEHRKKVTRFFPIESLHYCAAVRHVKGGSGDSSTTRFLPLDSPFARNPSANHPPLFAAVLRRTTGIKVLECHAFICKRDMAANALVRCCFHAYADSSYAKGLDPSMATITNSEPPASSHHANGTNGNGSLYHTLGGSNTTLDNNSPLGTRLDTASNDDISLYNGDENHKVWAKGRDEVDAVYQEQGTMRSTRGSRPRQLIAPPPPPPPPPPPSQPLLTEESTSSTRRKANKKLKKLKNRTAHEEPMQISHHPHQIHPQAIYTNGHGHHTLGHPIRQQHYHSHQMPPTSRSVAGTLARPAPVLLVPAATLPRKAHHHPRGIRPIPAAAPIVPVYAPLPVVPPPPAALYQPTYGTSGNRGRRHQEVDSSTLGVNRRLAASHADLTASPENTNTDNQDNDSRYGTGIYRRKGHLNERAFSYSIRAEHRSRSHGSLASLGFTSQNGSALPKEEKKDREIAQMVAGLNLDDGHDKTSYNRANHHPPQPLPRPRPR